MKLFLFDDAAPSVFTLPAEESAHAVRVLRLGAGGGVHVTDGRGNLFECQIVTADPKACVVRVVETFSEWDKRPCRLTLGIAPTKNSDRTEWLLEKATEIGMDCVVPIECANSERRVFFKPERARRVMVGAVKQSLKAYVPELQEVTPFTELVARPFDGVKLIAHCRETKRENISDALLPKRDTLILIGPEGDFTEQEVALAEANGFRSVSLGPSRLRTETAGLVAVTATYLKNLL